MNVISVNKYFWKKGGSESVFFSEKLMLESAGHKVIPFSMQGSNNEPTEYSKYFVEEVDYGKSGILNRVSTASKIIYSFDAKAKMEKLLGDISVDLAHFHIFQHQISPSVFGSLNRRGIPIILTLHDLKPMCPNYKMFVNGAVCEACLGGKFYNCFKNRCTKGSALGSLINTIEMYFHSAMSYYKNVDRYIAVSKFYQKKMIEFGFSSEKVAYLPNYIDVSDFDCTKEDKRYVLYFGRLSEEKGVATYIDSAIDNMDIEYRIVGTGPLEAELRAKVKSLNLENIEFLGFKSGSELKLLLAECTAVVVPSEWYENCPMTILEAFASGRPVVGANIGGIPELIESDIDGYIFEPGNVGQLSQKIRLIWDDRIKGKKMGMMGRKKIEKQFNSSVHYSMLLDIYKSVLSDSR